MLWGGIGHVHAEPQFLEYLPQLVCLDALFYHLCSLEPLFTTWCGASSSSLQALNPAWVLSSDSGSSGQSASLVSLICHYQYGSMHAAMTARP